MRSSFGNLHGQPALSVVEAAVNGAKMGTETTEWATAASGALSKVNLLALMAKQVNDQQ